MNKNFKIHGEQIKQLISTMGGCYATDKIMVDGEKVGFMEREKPDNQFDSGWRFMSGSESQEYADDPDNWAIYEVNTVANYDESIIPYLELKPGVILERIVGTDKFKKYTL